ncbi:MAG: hypothetical protein QOJ50_930, partial [Cryptosporangiaceae bacterium]|nr:hypothetical protein [Cryptosporangiaceae bacterium]
FEDEEREGPVVPALSVLRRRDRDEHPQRPSAHYQQPPSQQHQHPGHEADNRPRERRAELPSWDDILFGARHKPNG